MSLSEEKQRKKQAEIRVEYNATPVNEQIIKIFVAATSSSHKSFRLNFFTEIKIGKIIQRISPEKESTIPVVLPKNSRNIAPV